MLYDPKWSETKSPPVIPAVVMPTTPDEVLRGLVAWLEGQPGGTEYSWVNPSDCLFCRYSQSLGNKVCGYSSLYRLVPGGIENPHLGRIEHDVAQPKPWTYAAALDRARALL